MFSNQRFRIYIELNNGSETSSMANGLDIAIANLENKSYKWMAGMDMRVFCWIQEGL